MKRLKMCPRQENTVKLLHPAYLSNYRVRAYGSLSVKGPSGRREEHPRFWAGGNLRSEGSRSE